MLELSVLAIIFGMSRNEFHERVKLYHTTHLLKKLNDDLRDVLRDLPTRYGERYSASSIVYRLLHSEGGVAVELHII